MAGRTMILMHKGRRLTVAEGMNDEVEFRIGLHIQTPKAKSFNAACKEAVKWLLDNAGDMQGDYER